MEKKFNDFYDEAIRLWGEEAQLRMCIEEMSELAKEICKYQRYISIKGQASQEKIEEVKQNIIEETADVLNCATQIARMFGSKEVENIRMKKIDRTFPKLEEFRKISDIKRATLLYIVKDGKVLLGQKLRGFGNGKFNGVGGKVNGGETITQAMLRETKEEFDIVPKNFRYVGNIFYDEFKDNNKVYFDTAIFVADDYEGEPKTTDEMKPIWFDKNNLPYDNMFPDDVYWLEKVLNGKSVNAKFVFDRDFNIIYHREYFGE